jgi:hypothetical protein
VRGWDARGGGHARGAGGYPGLPAAGWLPLPAEMPARLPGLAAGSGPGTGFAAHQQASGGGRYRIGTAPLRGHDPG